MAAPMKMTARPNFLVFCLSKSNFKSNLNSNPIKTHRLCQANKPPPVCVISRHLQLANVPERDFSALVSGQQRTGHCCYATLAERTCWRCGRNNGFDAERFFCKCGIIQEIPEDITLFDVLGVERSFDVDHKQLKKHFNQFQMKLHPDKYSQGTKQEKQLAEEQSAMLNNAYFTLLKPLSRGLYLLKLHGEEVEEGTAPMDSGFLMEIMELNEQIAEADTEETVIKLGKDNVFMLKKLEKKLSGAFRECDIKLAKETVKQWKYYDNLDQKIKDLERERGIMF